MNNNPTVMNNQGDYEPGDGRKPPSVYVRLDSTHF